MPQLGDTLRFSVDLYDKPVEDGGVLVNATVQPTLTVTRPDLTTVTPSVTHPPAVTGKYFVDVATTVGGATGPYRGAWLLTTATGTVAYQETFEVSASLVTLDEVLAHLRARDLLTKDDDLEQLEWLAAVATDSVERDLDRVLVLRTFTAEKWDGGKTGVVLLGSPVVAVTAVTENGTALPTGEGTDWVTDLRAGIVYRGTSTGYGRWATGRQNVAVTYQAGYASPPPIARKVALTAVERMWETSQQAGHPLIDDVSADAAVFAAVSNSLTPIERAGYEALRRPGIG